jgi:hypothetical protein
VTSRRAAWLVAALLVAGVVLRLALFFPLHRFAPEGDCTTIAFGAWEILAGDLRVFLSTGYRHGALPCYLTAAASWFVGPGRAALTLAVLAVGVLQMFAWWAALLELTGWNAYDAASARLLAFIVLPSSAVLFWGIYWPNGYPDVLLAATLVFWAGARFWRRGGTRELFALGLVCGFAFWMSMLNLAIILPVLGWLLWQRHRTILAWRALSAATGGALLGALPWVLFNLRYDWVSLTANWAVRPIGGSEAFMTNLRRLVGEVLPTLFAAAAQVSPMPPLSVGRQLSVWVALALGAIAAFSLAGALARSRRGDPGGKISTRELPALVVLVVAIAATTAILFLFSAAAAVPGNIVRYIFLSFLVWPLVVALAWEVAGRRARVVLGALALTLLASYAFAAPWPWTALRRSARVELDVERQMVAQLEASGVEAVFGSFWEVYPLIFESGGRIGGAPIEEDYDFHRFTQRLPTGACRWAYVSRTRQGATHVQNAGFPGYRFRYDDGRWLFISTVDPAAAAQPTCRESLATLRTSFRG